jgi:hypothetical protein
MVLNSLFWLMPVSIPIVPRYLFFGCLRPGCCQRGHLMYQDGG